MQINSWMQAVKPYLKINAFCASKRAEIASVFGVFLLPLLLLMLFSILSIAIVPYAFASSETILTNNQGGIYFTGSSADPLTLYQDAIGGNIDVGIRLCGYGARYVGGFYAINVSGTYISSLITYQSSSQALSFTDSSIGGGCFETTPGFLTISPSNLATPSPNVYKAAFPGRIWTGYDVVANPGAVSTFVVGGNDSYLRGNYTVVRSFDYATRQVTIQTPTINYESTSSNFSKSASDAAFGISSDRRMVIGVCADAEGTQCADGQVYTSSTFPTTFTTDLTAGQVTDQQTSTRYIVINGIGQPFCAGSNLQMSIDAISPVPSYYSQNLTIQTTVTNSLDSPYEFEGGNVPVTTPFSVNIVIYNSSNPAQVGYNQTTAVNPSLLPSGSSAINFTYPAYLHSGQYTIVATVDSAGAVAECNESDNNANFTFYLYPIVIPTVRIDQVVTNYFPYPNIPYWVNMSFINSDNETLPNSTVQLVEINGLSLNAGTQLYNITSGSLSAYAQSGVVSKTIAQTQTDFLGNTSFTYVPTYNQLYESQYSYLNTTQHIGNSRRYMTGTLTNGSDFIFIVSGNVTTEYPFYITSSTYNVTVAQKSIYYNTTISQSFDNIYRVFTNYLKALIG